MIAFRHIEDGQSGISPQLPLQIDNQTQDVVSTFCIFVMSFSSCLTDQTFVQLFDRAGSVQACSCRLVMLSWEVKQPLSTKQE